MTVLRTGVAVLAATVWGAAGVASQEQGKPPAFRSGVQLVEIDARVFDAAGRFVGDIRRDEVEIVEDGRPQTIVEMFLVGGAPGVAGASASPLPEAAPRVPQTWIFVFDQQHLKPNGFRRAKVALDAFMAERFRAGDLAGIVVNEKMVDNRISSVRAEFLAALSKVKVPTEAAARAADAAEAQSSGGDGEAGATIRELLSADVARQQRRAARTTVEMLDGLADGLSRMPGPKTVVVISEGFALVELDTTLRKAVGNFSRAGARIYAVDARGIAGPPVDAMNSLALDTGGMVLFNRNDMGAAFDLIAADTNAYYVIAYQPVNSRYDGKFRQVDVRVNRPGVSVRARRGYLAIEPSKMLVPRPPR
jgi:VWFA-related protein